MEETTKKLCQEDRGTALPVAPAHLAPQWWQSQGQQLWGMLQGAQWEEAGQDYEQQSDEEMEHAGSCWWSMLMCQPADTQALKEVLVILEAQFL